MLVVTALGGNALLKRGQPPDLAIQRRNLAGAAGALAVVARDHDLVVTHGNGPQVGYLALQAEAARSEIQPYPLDVLDAESEGMIGYLLEQALAARLPGRELATLLTWVEVAADDPALLAPSKPIGPVYTKIVGERLAAERGWQMTSDGDGLRRVVPSPRPRKIVQLPTIRRLVEAGVIVICAGGGGIPVLAGAGGSEGVEAVVDKDLTAALLATELAADALLLLTDVPGVVREWGAAHARNFGHTTPRELRQHDFAPGSMGPKVEAACRFVEATGAMAGIGAIDDAGAILAGEAGTAVTAG